MSNSTPADESRIDSTHHADEAQYRASENAEPVRETSPTPASAHDSERDAIAGSLSNVRIQVQDDETALAVTPIRDEPAFSGVDLRWKTDTVSVGLALDTTAARALIDTLQSAVDAVDGASRED